jgi:hypothetical protein
MTSSAESLTAEVLPPALTRGQARNLETSARRHWRAASRNALVFAAELRRLHDGGAHLVRGYDNFAIYAEQTFDGLTAHAAKQLSRQGGVLLALEQHGRVTLDGGALPVATTALRALSVVQNTYGEEVMLAVYDRALELRPGRAIVEQTVKAAMRERLALPEPPGGPAGAGEHLDPAAPDVDAQDDDELSDELAELVDRLDILRRHIDDLRLSVEDPVLARRELRNVVEEIEQVKAAMTVAYG